MVEIDAILYDVTNKSPAASWKINLALESNPVSVKNVFKYNSCSRYPKQVVTLTSSSCEFEYCRSLMSQTVKVVTKCIKHMDEIWGYILSTVYWTCTRRKMGEHFELDFNLKI